MALTQLFQDSEYRSGLEDGSTKVLIKKVSREICRTAMCIDGMRYRRKKEFHANYNKYGSIGALYMW